VVGFFKESEKSLLLGRYRCSVIIIQNRLHKSSVPEQFRRDRGV
jgi:hypothetical protein